MKKVQEFRRRAVDCRAMAAKAPTLEVKDHYQSLAEIWDRLAQERVTFFIDKDEQAALEGA